MSEILQQPTIDSFIAIAHPVRRQLLDALTDGEQSVKSLAQPFAATMTRPAISQHLRILLDAGLVAERRAGRSRIYRIQPGGLRDVRVWLRKYERFWRERLDALGVYLDDGQEEREV